MARPASPYAVEFLADDPSFERVFLFYKPSLDRLGITVTVRTVDDAQYENRLRNWDFDIITDAWGESLSPGNEQRGYWGSQAADQPGSHNLIGIKNPAVDKLIDQVVFAKSRADLVAATKALDRVLLWNNYVVPQWTYGKVRTRALGPFRPSRSAAEIRHIGVPDRVVVGRRESGEDRKPAVISGLPTARRAAPGAIGCRTRQPLPPMPGACGYVAGAHCRPTKSRSHGISAFGDLEYPADFQHFATSIRTRRRAACFRRSGRIGSSTRISSPSIRSTATSSRAMPPRAWS